MPEVLIRTFCRKTARGALLNRPSCPPDNPIGQGIELKWSDGIQMSEKVRLSIIELINVYISYTWKKKKIHVFSNLGMRWTAFYVCVMKRKRHFDLWQKFVLYMCSCLGLKMYSPFMNRKSLLIMTWKRTWPALSWLEKWARHVITILERTRRPYFLILPEIKCYSFYPVTRKTTRILISSRNYMVFLCLSWEDI